jgi:hypothetical protein
MQGKSLNTDLPPILTDLPLPIASFTKHIKKLSIAYLIDNGHYDRRRWLSVLTNQIIF